MFLKTRFEAKPPHSGRLFLSVGARDACSHPQRTAIRVYCDEDPFRIDCMRAVLRRLEHMTSRRSGNTYAPTPDERREAIERLQKLIDELGAASANIKPIDYEKASTIALAEIELQEAASEY